MHRLFILPLKSLPLKLGAFALATLFILTACGGFTIDLNSFEQDSECSANPFLTECDSQRNISAIRTLIIEDCADNPEKANTRLCLAAEGATNPPSDNENGAVVEEVVDNTPKNTEVKIEFDKDSLTKTDKEKGETTSLEIVDLCSDPANANNERCSPAVINCINNPFSGSCQGDNLLGNFVRGGVTVSKTVVLQDKRAVDCRDGNIDRAQCQTLNSEKQRCTGAAFSTDAICSAVTYSVCKADAFDPLCGEKENFAGVYFNERSEVCFEDPNNPNCTGTNGHVAVVCSEYPFDRLCTGNADYDDVRATACESDPSVSASCPAAPAVEVADVCLDNPFGPTCADSDYNNARKELAKTCAIQAVTGAVTSACDTIIAAALPCFINPFNTVCDSNPAVKTYIAQLRSTRVALCNSNLRIASLCTGAPVAKSVCQFDPFDTVCLGDSDYAGDRLSACRDGSATTGQCGNIIAKVCGNDPFDALCGSGYNDDRANFCRNSVEPVYRCLKVEDRVCATNPLDSLCSASIYADARINACRNDQSNPSCRTIIANLCHRDNNPFDSLCGSSYDGIRESVCASNPNSSRCSDTLTRVCGGNPFDRLCRNTQSYLNTRVSICRGNPADGRCSWTIGSICRDDPFDPLCGNGYTGERETACRNGSNNTQCGNVIAGVCSGNPFDALCGNGYTGERETACRNGSNNTQCGNVIAGVCSGNPFDPLCGSGYTQNRRNACTDDPFAPRCAGAGYNDLRVSFCEDNVGNHPECPAPEPQVTAKVWADSFDTPLSERASAEDTESQFLIGRATDLDTGGRSPYSTRSDYTQGLNLADATFNFPRDYLGWLALGGDAADGVAFFAAEGNNDEVYNYAGILEGTNLGAPLTETQGSAKWVGSFQEFGSYPTDFVLNISFGTGDGAGEIEAFIQEFGYWYDYHLTGEFDDTGVITGTARGGIYRIHDPDNRGTTLATGELTGLIGEEGAVGAFLVGDYFGGFVARPSSADELWQLEYKCADNPFHKLCNVGYEDERKARVEYCIIGGNANDTTRCGPAEESFFRNETYYCFKHPFLSNCSDILIGYYEQTLANRVAFCRTEGNAGNELCTPHGTYDHICTTYPFDAQCLGDNDYDQTRQDACTIAGAGSTQCELLAGLTCGSDPFSSYCGGGYDDARETACRNGGANTQCGGIISGICGGNPFDPLCGSGYTLDRRNACSGDPFATRCAGEVYNDLRVTFCENNAGTHPSCPAPTPQVTAKVWADSFDEPLSHGATAEDTESKFLIGRATDLDTGGVKVYGTPTNLNLADATFNGVALGGDRADGVAYFITEATRDGGFHSYAGILSGTNLGAPLTDTEGSAKWLGSFLFESGSPKDFVLNISFGTGDGAGEIEAIVKNYGYGNHDYHIFGEFNDAGVITGTVGNWWYRMSEPNNSNRATNITSKTPAKLTGLIGEEGAVGVFVKSFYYGGFVARPPSEAELRTLEQTCASDPFNKGCTIGYEAERNVIIEYCIIGGNANDERCDSAKVTYACIEDPFGSYCGSSFREQVRANRLAFCRTVGNADNALCTERTTFVHICMNHPFDAQCLGDYDFQQYRRFECWAKPFATRCAGEEYNDLRVSFCEGKVGTHPSCPAPTPQVTAKVWADSFDTPLAHGATAEDTESKFLIGRETDLDTGGVSSAHPYEPDYNKGLNLADATFNGVALGGDAADGVAFFAAGRSSNGHYSTHSYAGILEGTNLGAPLTDTQGSAKWIGSFRYEDADPTDFVLNISFGTGDGAGEVEALVLGYYSLLYGYGIYRLDGYGDYHLKGEFDDAGVITGTARRGFYRRNDPDNRGQHDHATGKLTGLIGEEGAVGAFFIDSYFGGFVARPSSADELQTVAQTCADNPFNSLCDIGYESERNAMIEHCIIDDNYLNRTRCKFAHTSRACLFNPFQIDCDARLPQYYEQARANRLAFCRTAGNADNALCTVETTFAHICTNHPFDAQCRGDNSYRSIRRDACLIDPFATRCTGDAYNDLRVSFCENNAGNPSCPRPVVPPAPVAPTPAPDTTSNRVTAADWVARVNPDAKPDLANPRDQFLQGKDGTLDTTGLECRRPDSSSCGPFTLTLGHYTINRDRNDGYAYFEGYVGETAYRYVGILDSTDLGAPLTGNAGTSVQWKGIGIGRYGFTLTITFDAAGGRLDAFVNDTGNAFWRLQNARFDTGGVITGTVNYQAFTDSDPTKPRDSATDGLSYTGDSVLSGLIGEEGAVAVFVRASGLNGWGGFVAYPTVDKVTFADWVADKNPDATADLANPRHQILQVKDGTLDTTGVTKCSDSNDDRHCGAVGSRTSPTVGTTNLNSGVFDGQRINGDINDGYATFRGFIGETYSQYAGILDSTDLGAPLTGDAGTSVQWNGVFNYLRDFVLTITFDANGGRLDAFIKRSDNLFYRLQNARFDAGGVITGTVNYQDFTDSDPTKPTGAVNDSVLSGLIGQEGAVAVFVGTVSGGFIAGPDITPDPDVQINDWTRKVGNIQRAATSVPRNQFLYFANTTGVRANSDGTGNATTEFLSLSTATFNGNRLGGGNAYDEIAFFNGYIGGTRHYYSGLNLFGSLGATLPVWQTGQPTSAEWKGAFGVMQGGSAVAKADLTLEVNFENRRLTAFVPVGTNHYLLDAGFNADDDGFFAGTVNFGAFTDTTNRTSTNTLTPGVLTGLIGATGAVGVFVSGSSTTDNGRTITGGEGENGFAGGFVACPYDDANNRCQR